MAKISNIFSNIEKLTLEDGQNQFLSSFVITDKTNEIEDGLQNNCYITQKTFIKRIINEIDDLSTEIQNDSSILLSVKNQKLLRTCYQIITSIGFSQCLIPGVGIKLTKRCFSAKILELVNFSDEQKYEMLTECTDFFTRSYTIPVLKKIILTLHLSDYIAALIQLSFAPLKKKPGTYGDFVMTCELYEKLSKDRLKYIQTYEYLVANCFQPTLMKELLVLQSVREPSPPKFVKRVVAKEMSRRLLASGGLLSLIRCFMESYDIDKGFDWRKIDMICKIVSTKHGTDPDASYLNNICSQLAQILTFNNTHYLTTAIACILRINEKFPQSDPVKELIKEVFQAFDYNDLISKSTLPGTIMLSPQEVENKINILNACLCTSKVDCPPSLLQPNTYVLFLLGVKCHKNEDLKLKLKDILLKSFELLNNNEVALLFKDCLFGKDRSNLPLQIENYDAGLAIKCNTTHINYPKEEALLYFLNLLKCCPDNNFVQNIFELSLSMLIDLNVKRKQSNKEMLSTEDEPIIFNEVDEQYITVLQLLSELSMSPKILSSLKNNPSTVLNFVEHFIMSNQKKSDEECVTIALVLINTILSNSQQSGGLKKRFEKLIPVLKLMAEDDSSINNVLCTEALSLIMSEKSQLGQTTEFQKAITDVFDNLLPVRAHGMIALTKLIDSKDVETISKKHYVFCLFQEYLKDPDSYIYLAAINGIASLGTYCPEDVLHVLCKEFLQISIIETNVETKTDHIKIAELRMKIGDIIVKVTKRLGEMAIVHKTILLNTVLCGCRDEDPLIRTSALSNLAEICLVLHYKMGSIIYEVLLCIWSILETDKAIECRRAAVMVISSLIKGLGKEVLIQLKDDLLPIYRTLKDVYNNYDEDSVLRLHAQIALEELNDIVKQFIFPELKMENIQIK